MRAWIPIFFLVLLAGCYRVSEEVAPKIPAPCFVKGTNAPSPFKPLREDEKMSDWAKEYKLGLAFAHECDLYRAITSFKRALFLLSETHPDSVYRRQEIVYMMLLSYYLGEKWEEAIALVESGEFGEVDQFFPAYHDLILILYDTYSRVGNLARATYFQEKIKDYDAKLASKMQTLTFLQGGGFPELLKDEGAPLYQKEMVAHYLSQKKNVKRASFLNAIMPGAGYYYVGLKQTAVCAFLVNGLFIAGAAEAFIHHNIPLGVILTSLESGWYFGGIYGGALAAKSYNENLYLCFAERISKREALFPILHLNFSF